jgi:hypothetical protein
MKIEQGYLTKNPNAEPFTSGKHLGQAQLVLVFGSNALLGGRGLYELVQKTYPQAHVLGCSTSGNICDTVVSDESVVVTAIHFDATELKGEKVRIDEVDSSYHAGAHLAQALDKEGLVHVFILSDGLKINGSELVNGLADQLPPHISVTGGLAGDGSRFSRTLVMWDSPAEEGVIVAVGLYSSRLKVGYASLGGWDSFGPERVITRSRGNVLYEMDGKSALALYKEYLGEHAAGLPATGLLFPLSVRHDRTDSAVVRTILSIDENEQSMTFAGDVPVGSHAQLMKANFDRLIDGAAGAAQASCIASANSSPDMAILISCVGRKLVLGQRIEEEVETARKIMGSRTVLTGFYSYGEISPFTPSAKCELHNQTMTITTLSEI